MQQGAGLAASQKLLAVGRARSDGVEVKGRAQPLGMTGFEAYAGSSAHRPAQFTFTSGGLSLQVGRRQPCRFCSLLPGPCMHAV